MKDYRDFGIIIPFGHTSGQVKTHCPQCRDTRSNKRDKSLSVDLNDGVWHCHYCGWADCLKERKEKPYFNPRPLARQKPEYKKPKPTASNAVSEKALAWFAGRGISRQTVEAMKITEGQEFMPQKDKAVNTVQFNYFRDGELVNTKFRTGDKYFKLVSGAELLPYNIDGIKGTKEAVITEGEMDTLSFIECGRLDTVSVPNGANANLSYLDDYIEDYFEDKDVIYIAVDTDTKGIALRDELIRRFGTERCRVVEYGEECKDANEHLIKFGKESLLECIATAPEIKIEGVFTVSDFEGSLDALFENGLQKGVTIGHENFDALCSFETKRLCIVTGVPSCGKALAIDTPIPTPQGWATMGDLQRGDTVFDEQGHECQVLAATEIMHGRPCYRVTFLDGSMIVCDAEHLWVTRDNKARRSERVARKNNRIERRDIKPHGTDQSHLRTYPSAKTTADIAATMTVDNGNRHNHAVRIAEPIEGKDNDLVISPYVLGVWLGDGSSHNASVNVPDMEIIDQIERLGYPTKRWKHGIQYGIKGLTEGLRHYGLVRNKHVPTDYLRASIDSRRALLSGLMDTDGYASYGGNCEYSTTRRCLADAVHELIVSLGMAARIVEGRAKLYGKDCGEKFRIHFTPNYPLFRVSRKAARLKEKTSKRGEWRAIVSCEPVPSVPVRCIKVSSPSHQYLCGRNMIPTHNSEFIDEIAERLNIRYDWRFAFFSPENAPLSYHASKLIEKFTGKKFGKSSLKYGEYQQVKKHLEDNFFFISPSDNFRLDNILEKAQYLVRRKGIKALVIDPYNRLESQQGNKNETQYISETLDRLTNFAQINDVLVILMAHPTKRPKNKEGEVEAPSLYDISGSANFFNKADFGLVVHRNRVGDYTEVHVQKVKFRHLGQNGTCVFKYNINNGRYTPCEAHAFGISPAWDNSNHLMEKVRKMDEKAVESAVLNFDTDSDSEYPF